MQRIAFKMKLFAGKADEYRARHDQLWPELATLLKSSGIGDYYIYLDEETNILFGTYLMTDEATVAALPQHPVMQKWWAHMADLMESNPDNSPVSAGLKPMFHLP